MSSDDRAPWTRQEEGGWASAPQDLDAEAAGVEVEAEEAGDEIILRLRLPRQQARHRELQERLEQARKEVARLGRSQFKANSLMEAAQSELTRLAGELSEAVDRRDRQIEQLLEAAREDRRAARLEMVRALLPALDALDEAVALADGTAPAHPRSFWRRWWGGGTDPGAGEPRPAGGWREGLTLVRRRLLSVLRAEGVEPMESVGRPFNPQRQAAVGTVRDLLLADGMVVEEQLKGYACGEQIVRLAEVVVNRHDASPTL